MKTVYGEKFGLGIAVRSYLIGGEAALLQYCVVPKPAPKAEGVNLDVGLERWLRSRAWSGMRSWLVRTDLMCWRQLKHNANQGLRAYGVVLKSLLGSR